MKVFFGLILLAALYLGYCLGMIGTENLDIETLVSDLQYAAIHPYPFRVSSLTLPAMAGMAGAWLIFMMKQFGDQKNYMPGKEYGSAKIISPAEVNKTLEDKDPHNNKIVSQNVRISMNTRQTGLNNNMVVIGGSGAGKSFYMVKPNGLNHASSMVYTDPKGGAIRSAVKSCGTVCTVSLF